jgi:hypothetical protein
MEDDVIFLRTVKYNDSDFESLCSPGISWRG